MLESVLTVRQLTEKLRAVVEGRFAFVWVRGEVSNLSRPASGHIYFSLKDADAQLQCVWFKKQHEQKQAFDPLTGEVFEEGARPTAAAALCNGRQWCCAGRLSVYAPRGAYQLVVEYAQELGHGALAAAFEAAKCALQAKGFFAVERKRPLPPNPQRVAVVTAPTGAAIHDFIRVGSQRGTGSTVRIYPALMQGAKAAQEIAAAIQRINAEGWAEVIVLVRGGGSLEDLWAFNELVVAEAVFHSALPVVAGIGHEVDVSLADMTADVRAATPSHAAQLLWQARQEYVQRVDEWEARLARSMGNRVQHYAARLDHAAHLLAWCSPRHSVARKAEQCQRAAGQLHRLGQEAVHTKQLLLTRWSGALAAQQPAQRCLRLAERLAALEFKAQTGLGARCLAGGQSIQQQEHRLHRALGRAVQQAAGLCEALTLRLEKCDPLSPLARGYALLSRPQGGMVSSAAALRVGDALHVLLHDGSVDVVVQTSLNKTAEGKYGKDQDK